MFEIRPNIMKTNTLNGGGCVPTQINRHHDEIDQTPNAYVQRWIVSQWLNPYDDLCWMNTLPRSSALSPKRPIDDRATTRQLGWMHLTMTGRKMDCYGNHHHQCVWLAAVAGTTAPCAPSAAAGMAISIAPPRHRTKVYANVFLYANTIQPCFICRVARVSKLNTIKRNRLRIQCDYVYSANVSF